MSRRASSRRRPGDFDEIRSGDRRALARAITLLESTRSDQAALGQQVLDALVPDTGTAQRVGVTGPRASARAPSSKRSDYSSSSGASESPYSPSIPAAPSPAAASWVTRRAWRGSPNTRRLHPALALRRLARRRGPAHARGDAALRGRGLRRGLIETVGIGQSEVTVASMVDFFLVLIQPGAGDDLQGIKKGVLELADALVVNKADGDQKAAAERAGLQHRQALSLLRPASPNWSPQGAADELRCSAHGIGEVWETVCAHRMALEASGELLARRREQARAWMWSLVEEGLLQAFRSHPAVAEAIAGLEEAPSQSRRPRRPPRLAPCWSDSAPARG